MFILAAVRTWYVTSKEYLQLLMTGGRKNIQHPNAVFPSVRPSHPAPPKLRVEEKVVNTKNVRIERMTQRKLFLIQKINTP
jgi:hypothetical protein